MAGALVRIYGRCIAEGSQVTSGWIARMPRRRRAGTVLAAGTTVMLLAGGGGAALAARAAPAGGIISTVAGGVGGPGPGTGISLSDANAAPGGCSLNTVAFAAGSLYIADGSVRKVSARTGLLTTPAGTGAAGPLTLGGPAATAPLGACGVAFDHAGNMVVADHLRHRIDVVPARTGTFYGRAMTAGHLDGAEQSLRRGGGRRGQHRDRGRGFP